MTTAEVYQRLRPLMFSIAYRMLGSVSEAEDIVQEAFLRYHAARPQHAAIGPPQAHPPPPPPAPPRAARAPPGGRPGRGAARAAADRRRGRPGRPGRADRLAVDGVPAGAGAAVPGGAGRLPAARRVQLRL